MMYSQKGGGKKRYHSKPILTTLPLRTICKLKIKKEIALDKMNLKHCKKQPGRGSEVQNRNTTARGSESEIRWGVSFVKRGSDVIAKSKLWNGEKQT